MRGRVRWVVAAAACAAAVAQVTTAELTGITTVGGSFVAGNERIAGVQGTLVAWFCAGSVPLVLTVLTRLRPDLELSDRVAAVPPAGLGTLAASVVVVWRGGDGAAVSGVVTGALLGMAVGFALARRPVIGWGLAAYATLFWVAALASLPFPRDPLVFAGLVSLRSDRLERELAGAIELVPLQGSVPLQTMVPFAVAVLLLVGVLAAVAVRRGVSWPGAVATAAIGPVLAAATYWLALDLVYLYNREAFQVVHWLALACLVVAVLSASAASGWSWPAHRAADRAAPTAG